MKNWKDFVAGSGMRAGQTTVRKRWVTMFIAFVAIPMILIIALFMKGLRDEAYEQAANYSMRYVLQMQKSLEYRMRSIESLMNNAIGSLYEEMQSSADESKYSEYYAINNLLTNLSDEPMVDKFRLYVPDDKVYAYQMDRFFPLSRLDESILEILRNDSSKSVWIGNYERVSYYSRSVDRVITCVSSLRSPSAYNTFSAVLFADIPIQRLCDFIALEEENETLLLDKKGMVIAAGSPEMIGQSALEMIDLESILLSDSGSYFSPADRGMQLTTWAKIENTPFIIINRLGEEQMQAGHTYPAMTVMIGLIICLALGFLFMFSYVLDLTIVRLNRAVYHLHAQGSHTPAEKKEPGKTLGSVEQSIENIAMTINDLLEENYQTKIESKESELRALQAQINPHFLYNTLDSIRWMILDGNEESSVKMINHLSQYFRFSLNKGRDIVPLRDEYHLTRSYLAIQTMRFDNRFNVETQVDETLLDCQVPKLTLQPIVENALLHGITDDQQAKIGIRIFREEQDVLIEISDNGEGMNREMIEEAFSRNINAKGYGIRNVNRRLQLIGGSLEICSEEHKGTSVRMRIPYHVQSAEETKP